MKTKFDLFQNRIVSREECPNHDSKTLSQIFPSSSSRTLIIDDRLDVWLNDKENLIQIYPCKNF